MRRRNVPCSPCSGGSSSGDCCGLKEKLRILWDRTIGSILRINGISPDGDGDFTIEAGDNIAITERGTGNGLRIDTTGGVSYYTSGDSYVNVDNNDLEISVNVGTGGLATDTDLQTVAGAVTDILDGTSTVPNATNAVNATNAQYLGSASSNVGDDTKPIKIINGQAVEVTNALQRAIQYYTFSDNLNVTAGQEAQATSHDLRAGYNIIISNAVFNSGSAGIGGFVFGVNIDGTTTWCQSMYQIPANDTVRITLSIAYSMNRAHRFAIKMYSSSNITDANVNTKVISL